MSNKKNKFLKIRKENAKSVKMQLKHGNTTKNQQGKLKTRK